MRKGSHISTLLRSKKTVFSSRDIALLWGDPGSGKSRVKLNYYVKTGELYRIRKGLYAKDKHYDRLELATRIFTPAYVSFETVLARAGVVFQYYERIFVASYLSREVICDDQTYAVRKIKAVLLTNPAGVDQSGEYAIANKERAFLDTLYISGDYYFDNLTPLDWDKVFALLPLYGNRRLERAVQTLHKHFQKSQ